MIFDPHPGSFIMIFLAWITLRVTGTGITG